MAPKIHGTQAAYRRDGYLSRRYGRGAFSAGGSHTGTRGGLLRSEHVGMSNDKGGANPPRRKPKVSLARLSAQGESVPKPRPKGVGDGQRVNIPVLPCSRLSDGGTQKGSPAGGWMGRCKPVGGVRRQIPSPGTSEG